MSFPARIRCLSDDTELEYVQPIPGQKKPLAKYIYTKAQTKQGLEVSLALDEIEYLISCRLMVIIE